MLKILSHLFKHSIILFVFVTICDFFTLNVYSQGVKIDDLNVDLVLTPVYSVSNTKEKRFIPKQWMVAEVALTFNKALLADRNLKLLDEITVKYYVFLKSSKKLLVGEVVHINIPLDEKLYSSMYVSPNSILKLLGKNSVSRSDVSLVAVELYYNGKLKAFDASKAKNKRWWRTPKATPLTGFMVSKDKTPFAPLWWDSYLQVKSKDK